MQVHQFILFVCSLWLLTSCSQQASEEAKTAERPNILLILADDLGWSQLGCYGGAAYRTPNIDQLAAEGMRFTQAYAAAAVCSPTRAAIMSGQHPARLHST